MLGKLRECKTLHWVIRCDNGTGLVACGRKVDTAIGGEIIDGIEDGVTCHNCRRHLRAERRLRELREDVSLLKTVKKRCTNCGTPKRLNEFYVQRRGGEYGRQTWCKTCMIAYARQARRNREAPVHLDYEDIGRRVRELKYGPTPTTTTEKASN